VTRVASVAICLIVGVAVLNDAVRAITITTGRSLFVFGGADGRLPLTYLPQLLQAERRDGSTGFLVDAPSWLRLLCASPAVVHAVTIALAAVVVIQIVRRIAAAQPFAKTVLRNWTRVSLILIIGGVIQGIVDSIAVQAIFDLASVGHQGGGEFPLGADYSGIGTNFPQWPFFMILLGIVAAAIATAFRAGAQLEDEAVGIV
jgi:hypothetical protein